MSVPGLFLPSSGLVVGVSVTSNTPFDLSVALGGISVPIRYLLFLPAGVVRGSNTLGVPSIDASGLHEDSIGLWFIDGDALGRGGLGMSQYVGAGSFVFTTAIGGGGGGAGAAVGGGGIVIAPGTDGSPGTDTTGGAEGTNGVSTFNADDPVSGEDGGDAIWTNHAITAVVNGSIHGGGGGGGLVPSGGSGFPQPGGDLDQAGSGSVLFGAAGNAVRLIGATAAFTVSSGAGFVGTVSA